MHDRIDAPPVTVNKLIDQTRVTRNEPSVWQVPSLITPWLFLVVATILSFGAGSLCTDEPGNGTLDQAPCNRVAYGAELNLGAQLLLAAIAIVMALRRASNASTLTVTVASAVVFTTSMIIMWSYR